MKAAPALLAACALALAFSGTAAARTSNDFAGHHRQVFRVVIVKGLSLGDLPQLATEGAVGLMVPNAGPRTSQAAAFAGMVRGIIYNTRLPRPHDPVLIRVTESTEIPAHGPVIVVGLPPATSAPNDRRYPIAVIGRGYHGLLTSSLTRVPGLVSIADVARTALQTPHALDWQEDGGPVATSYRLEPQIEIARSTTMPGSVLVMSLLVFFALLFPRGTLRLRSARQSASTSCRAGSRRVMQRRASRSSASAPSPAESSGPSSSATRPGSPSRSWRCSARTRRRCWSDRRRCRWRRSVPS